MLSYSHQGHTHIEHRGLKIPSFLYGTAWKEMETEALAKLALESGFLGIDTANQRRHYYEAGVGKALQHVLEEGNIKRGDLFLQTKFTPAGGQDPTSIPYNPRDPLDIQVKTSVEKSLQNLKTDFIDSLLIHSPLGPQEGGMNGTLTVWKTLEEFVKQGKIKQLGISNMYDLKELEKLWNSVEVKPAVVQNRFYADTGYDVGVRTFCTQNQIFYQSFWTLTANPNIVSSSVVVKIARERNKTPEQIFFRALMKMGIVPLSGTTHEVHMLQDVEVGNLTFDLSSEEVQAIKSLLK